MKVGNATDMYLKSVNCLDQRVHGWSEHGSDMEMYKMDLKSAAGERQTSCK